MQTEVRPQSRTEVLQREPEGEGEESGDPMVLETLPVRLGNGYRPIWDFQVFGWKILGRGLYVCVCACVCVCVRAVYREILLTWTGQCTPLPCGDELTTVSMSTITGAIWNV